MKQSNVITLSHPEKIYWPQECYTKQDLMDYYHSVADFILPFLKNRPIVLRRYPNGINQEGFIQKNTDSLHLPEGIKTVKVSHEDKSIDYILIQNVKALEYVVNLGSIELHPFHSSVNHLDFPDYFVLDLDPESVPFNTVIEVANIIHALLDEWKIPNYCKTSGGRGLHLYIPLHAKYTIDQVLNFGKLIGVLIHEKIPKITSLERHPADRQKKIYLDVLQNRAKQTIVAPYSVRGRNHATVSTPLHFDELKKGLKPEDFTIKTVPARLKQVGEIFYPVLRKGFNIKDWIESRK